MASYLRFTEKGIYCIPGDFYIDPWRPVERAVISHGHADHARAGMKHYLCHEYTKPIIQHRISKHINVHAAPYGEVTTINGVKVSLHPAGHLVGSAQIRLEHKGEVAVFSGDYKVDPDDVCTPFEPIKCDTFITESTFGLPIYKWKSNSQLKKELSTWASDQIASGKTCVLLGYSLGKAQRIMSLIDGAGEIHVHKAVHHMNEAISSSGVTLPEYQLLAADQAASLRGKIIVAPPAFLESHVMKKIPDTVTAFCSGWMQVRGRRKWRSVDAGFAISDHADWDGLLSAVKETGAQQVYVTHGSQATFARYLNETGIKASELKTSYGEMEEAEEIEAKLA